MIGRRCTLFALSILLILIVGVNVYFIRIIVENSSSQKKLPELKTKQDTLTSSWTNEKKSKLKRMVDDIDIKIKENIRLLPSKYFKQNTSYVLVLERLVAELKVMSINVREDIWNLPNNHVS